MDFVLSSAFCQAIYRLGPTMQLKFFFFQEYNAEKGSALIEGNSVN